MDIDHCEAITSISDYFRFQNGEKITIKIDGGITVEAGDCFDWVCIRDSGRLEVLSVKTTDDGQRAVVKKI